MLPRSHRWRVVVLVLGLFVAAPGATLAGQGSKHPGARPSSCVPGSIHGMGTARLSYAATAIRALDVRRTLHARERLRFQVKNVNGVATVFGIIAARVDAACRTTQYKVHLPVRPNGSTGWLRSVDVRVGTVRTRITVDLSKRRITLFRDGRIVLLTTAAIGAPSTPTPTGRFYVNQRLLAASPMGGYGPGAVGISAFSPVLLNWPQGGPIAIHGTDAPSLIGTAVSHGCLRVHNDAARRFLQLAEPGTPVEIRP